MNTTYTVIYRTGGTERCTWRRTFVAHRTRESARKMADDIERMGYKAIIHVTRELDVIGLPEGWYAADYLVEHLDAEEITLEGGC